MCHVKRFVTGPLVLLSTLRHRGDLEHLHLRILMKSPLLDTKSGKAHKLATSKEATILKCSPLNDIVKTNGGCQKASSCPLLLQFHLQLEKTNPENPVFGRHEYAKITCHPGGPPLYRLKGKGEIHF